MPRTTFIATAPDGSTHKRTSETKTYAFAILTRKSYEHAAARAADPSWRKQAGETWDYHKRVADGGHDSDVRRSWENDEQFAARRAKEKDLFASLGERAAYVAKEGQDRIDNIERLKAEGHFEKWGALTWCSRHDLAMKELGKARGDAWNAEAVCVPVEVK